MELIPFTPILQTTSFPSRSPLVIEVVDGAKHCRSTAAARETENYFSRVRRQSPPNHQSVSHIDHVGVDLQLDGNSQSERDFNDSKREDHMEEEKHEHKEEFKSSHPTTRTSRIEQPDDVVQLDSPRRVIAIRNARDEQNEYTVEFGSQSDDHFVAERIAPGETVMSLSNYAEASGRIDHDTDEGTYQRDNDIQNREHGAPIERGVSREQILRDENEIRLFGMSRSSTHAQAKVTPIVNQIGFLTQQEKKKALSRRSSKQSGTEFHVVDRW